MQCGNLRFYHIAPPLRRKNLPTADRNAEGIDDDEATDVDADGAIVAVPDTGMFTKAVAVGVGSGIALVIFGTSMGGIVVCMQKKEIIADDGAIDTEKPTRN